MLFFLKEQKDPPEQEQIPVEGSYLLPFRTCIAMMISVVLSASWQC